MLKLNLEKSQSGQVVIIALLVMVVVLVVVLSAVGRSISEISTSTKTEDSSRAFSAAEAGIEKTMSAVPGSSTTVPLDNGSQSDVEMSANLPLADKALEYDPFGKESFAQFWLANPGDMSKYYNQPSFRLYFGQKRDYSSDPDNQPAVQVRVVLYNPTTTEYYDKKYLYDSYGTRSAGNNFNNSSVNCSSGGTGNDLVTNDNSIASSFYCQVTVPLNGDYRTNALQDYPIMARVRLLYTNLSHPVALAPNSGGSLPPQANISISTGSAGNAQRTIRLFQQKYVLPSYFDYALFSASNVTKN